MCAQSSVVYRPPLLVAERGGEARSLPFPVAFAILQFHEHEETKKSWIVGIEAMVTANGVRNE